MAILADSAEAKGNSHLLFPFPQRKTVLNIAFLVYNEHDHIKFFCS